MRLLVAMVRQEWRLQWRSTRFRLSLPAFLALGVAPPVVVATMVAPVSELVHGPTTYLAHCLVVLPLLTAVLCLLVAGNGSDHASLEKRWCPLASARISSGGWLVRRWLALVILLLPATLLPLLGAVAVAWWAAGAPPPAETLAILWLTRVAPIVLIASAFWLGAVTIVGGELSALIASAAILLGGPGVLNEVLLRFRFRLDDPLALLGVQSIRRWAWEIVLFVTKPESRWREPGFAATEAPLDITQAWARLLGYGAPLALLACVTLGLAVAHTQRTRRDLRPWVVGPKHPLRNMIQIVNGWRQRYAADAGRSRADRGLRVTALLAAVVVGGLWIERQLTWKAMASEHYDALARQVFDPNDPRVRPTHSKITGRLQANGTVDVETTARWHNAGDQPVTHLTLLLNAGLEVAEIGFDGRETGVERRWDRLRLTFDPALAAGETADLRIRVIGAPSHPEYGLSLGNHYRTFARGFELQKGARFSRDLHDFSRGSQRPAISARWVDLRPGDLTPIPRYTDLELTPRSDSPGESGREVRQEAVKALVDLEVDLEAPADWFLAEACGSYRSPSAEPSRLRGRCTLDLGEWVVMGGSHRVVEGASGTAVAMLEDHLDRGANLLASVGVAMQLSNRAWPGVEGLDRLVVVEQPPDVGTGLLAGMSPRWYDPFRVDLKGRLVRVPEPIIVGDADLEGESLVAIALARDLLARRELAIEQQHFFRRIFEALTIRRMGLDERGGAASGPPWIGGPLQRPFLEATIDSSVILSIGLPAVMVEVESRIGAAAFYRAVDAFLDLETESPATLGELFSFLEAETGVRLAQIYQDFFVDGALPKLELAEVETTRHPGRWEVRGVVRNTGSGEVECPVVVKTEIGEHRTRLLLAGDSSVPFEISTTSRPLRALLDPELTCYRLALGQFRVLERVDLGIER